MIRLLWITLSVVLGLVAASQLPAGDKPQRSHPRAGGNISSAKQSFSPKSFSGAPKQFHNAPLNKAVSQPNFNNGPKHSTKPFKPTAPITRPKFPGKPIGPITGNPGFPIKTPIVKQPKFPTKPIGPIVGQPGKPKFPIKPNHPIKPIDPPIGKPWPPKKPICPPHKHCPPKCPPPCFGWPHDEGTVAVCRPVVVHVPSPIIVEGAQVLEAVQRQEVQVGSTLEFPVQHLGIEQGGVMLKIGAISLGCMVNEWSDNGVQATLPMMHLERPTEGDLVIVLPDGAFAVTVPVLLFPAEIQSAE